MIALFLSGFLSMFFFTTFGVYVVKITKTPANFTEKILMGLVVSNTITTCLSLFFPINIFILLALVLVCILILFLIKKELKTLYYLLINKKYILFCSLPFILIAFFISLSSPMDYDTGLYHLQSIKWIEQYPVVPGLANLHSRFGFNPNIFTFFALTSLYDIFKQEIFSVNFVIFSVLVIYFVDKLFSLYKEQGLSNLFIFYFVLLVVILQCSYSLSSPAPDFLSQTIPLFIFARIIDLSGQKKNTAFTSYFPVLVLIMYILTVKLATFPIVLLFFFIIIKYKFEFKKSLLLYPIFGLIIAPWLIRNIFLTGWLIYPLPSLDLFDFDWEVPLANVALEKKCFIQGSLMDSEISVRFLTWFPVWWNKIGILDRLIYLSSLFCPIIVLAIELIKKRNNYYFINAVVFTSFLGIIYILIVAPLFRYGIPFIVVTSISLLLYIKFHWKPVLRSSLIFSTIMIIFTGLYIIIISLGFFKMYNFQIIEMNINRPLYSAFLIKPKNIITTEHVTFETYTINGINIHVPSGHDCFDHCIPCTYYLDTTLVLRGETIKDGFKHALNLGKQDKKTIEHIKKQAF